MQIQVISPVQEAWDAALASLRHDFYHQAGFHALEAERLGGEARSVVVRDGGSLLFAPFVLRGIPGDGQGAAAKDASPVYGYPGLLANGDALASAPFMRAALGGVEAELANLGVCAAFLPLHPILSNQISSFIDEAQIGRLGQTVSFDLSLDEATLWSHIKKGHRTVLNKCQRVGMESTVVPFAEGLDELMDTYLDTMKRVSAKDAYFFERSYFERLNHCGPEAHICHVKRDGVVVAACVFFERCGILQAHLGGTKSEHMNHSPFSYVFYSMALWGKKRGLDYLHVGGGVGGAEDRLFSFKEGFSRLRHDWLAWRLVVDKPAYEERVRRRAAALGRELEAFRQERFFPLYRAS